MKLDEYQKQIETFDLYAIPKSMNEEGFVLKMLGIAGEAGEVVEKAKKIIRDKGGVVSEKDKIELTKELGDVLWYVATISRYLGVSLSEVAEGNIKKLADRKNRDLLHGAGDNR